MPMLKETMLKRLLLPMVAAGGGGSTPVQDTATGNPLVFFTNLARPLKSLLIPFTPKQSGTGDPSPSNIRPIAPWNGLTVKHGGSNLLLTADIIIGKWINGSGATNNDSRGAITSKINVESSTDYILSYNGERPLSFAVVEYNASGGFIKRNYVDTDQTATDEISFSTNANTKAVICEFYTRNGDMTEAVLESMKWQFEKGSRTDYNDTATETDISFPSPVYGGTLDAVTGVLTVEWVSLTKTWGDFANKTSLGDNTRGTLNISSYPSKPLSEAVDAKCNIAPRDAGLSTDSTHFYTNEGSCVVFIPNDTDASTEIQVVYPLATPQEIQLTTQQITALIGNNTIWSDADGSMTAIYLKKG